MIPILYNMECEIFIFIISIFLVGLVVFSIIQAKHTKNSLTSIGTFTLKWVHDSGLVQKMARLDYIKA